MITVRRATLDDFDVMAAAYTAAWREGFRHMFAADVFADDRFDTERREECRASTLQDHIDTYVAENESRVAGFVTASKRGRIVEVDDVWVHPHSWGCGAASALISRVEDDLRAVGGRMLTTWVPEDSPVGRRFFEKIGWRPTGNIELLAVYPQNPNRIFEYSRTLA
jgi:GNAT superfamily N-acetyltransferase